MEIAFFVKVFALCLSLLVVKSTATCQYQSYSCCSHCGDGCWVEVQHDDHCNPNGIHVYVQDGDMDTAVTQYKTLFSDWYKQIIKYVKIYDNLGKLKTIADEFFKDYIGLETVSISSPSGAAGIKTIGAKAFYNCSKLKSISFPGNSIQSIGPSAFQHCTSLETVSLNGTLDAVNESVFEGCSRLKAFTIPNSVKTIKKQAFKGCYSMTTLNLPPALNFVRDSAFYGCSSISALNLPSTVTSIGMEAFRDCRSIKNLTIPRSIQFLGNYAFYGCEYTTLALLNDYAVEKASGDADIQGSPVFAISVEKPNTIILGGNIPNNAFNTVYCVFCRFTSVTILDGVKEIGTDAFRKTTDRYGVTRQHNFSSIVIPSSVNYIGQNAFYYVGLKKVFYYGTSNPSTNIVFVESTAPDFYVTDGYTGTKFCNANSFKKFQCLKGTCCDLNTFRFKSDSIKCSNSSGPCEADSYCTGNGEECPTNYLLKTTVCNESSGPCELTSYCTGKGADCPAKQLRPKDYECNHSSGGCESNAFCDGKSATCPDKKISHGICAYSSGPCENDAYCDGISPSCPTKTMKNSSVVCSHATQICEMDSYCTGTSPECPPNPLRPKTYKCANETPCNLEAYCTGNHSYCEVEGAFYGQICGEPPGPCQYPPRCSIYVVGECWDSNFKGPSVKCANASNPCELDSYCTGNSAECPPIVRIPNCTVPEDSDSSGKSSVTEKSSSAPVSCPEGQYAHEGKCYNCPAALFCATCSDATRCDTCKDGYKLNGEGQCAYDCEVVFGEGCSRCTEKKCLECTKQGCCEKKKFYWNASFEVCQNPEEMFGIGCMETDGEKCTNCTAPTCCSSAQFFDLSSLTCKDCTKYDAECNKCTPTVCMGCGNDKILDAGGKCLTCSDVYGEGCVSCNEKKCNEIEDGYTVIGTVVKKCSEMFGSCTACQASGCNTDGCGEGYKNFNGYCKKCSEVFGESCSECDNEKCIGCSDNSLTIVNGVCADCAIAHGEGCDTCENKECTSPLKGFFVFAGYAINCNVLPETVRQTCIDAVQRSRSVSIRDAASDGSEVDVTFNGEVYTVSCSDAIPNCSVCGVSGEGHLSCSACSEGYVLYGGVCKACDSVHGDSCDKCSLTACSGCGENTVDVSGKCISCGSVNAHCSKCDAVDSCTECEEGFVKKDGSCMTCQVAFGSGCASCSESGCDDCSSDSCCSEQQKIIVKDNKMTCGTCEDLTSGCANCTSTTCLTCADNKVLSASGECKSCSELFSGCSECNSDVCTKCDKDSWILTDSGCYNPSPSGSDNPSDSESDGHGAVLSVGCYVGPNFIYEAFLALFLAAFVAAY